MTPMVLLRNKMLNVIMFAELNFSLNKWHKGNFDLSWNDIKLGLTILLLKIVRIEILYLF